MPANAWAGTVLLVEHWSSGGTAHYASRFAAALSSAAPDTEVALLVPTDFTEHPTNVRTLSELPPAGDSSSSRVLNLIRLVKRRWMLERRIARTVRTMKPDVLHMLGASHVSGRVLRAARRSGSRVQATVHDIPAPKGVLNRLTNADVRLLSRVSVVFVHGEASRRTLEDRLGQTVPRVGVIPFGSFFFGSPAQDRAEARARYGVGQDLPTFLFFGSLRISKGLFMLLEAFASLDRGSAQLLVVGHQAGRREPQVAAYQARAAELGVEEWVSWHIGFVDDSEIPDLFNAVDWVVLPYDKTFNAQSAVLSTALAYGRPVIVTDVGELGPHVIALGCGVVVPPGSVRDLAAGLQDAISGSVPKVAGPTSWESVAESVISHSSDTPMDLT